MIILKLSGVKLPYFEGTYHKKTTAMGSHPRHLDSSPPPQKDPIEWAHDPNSAPTLVDTWNSSKSSVVLGVFGGPKSAGILTKTTCADDTKWHLDCFKLSLWHHQNGANIAGALCQNRLRETWATSWTHSAIRINMFLNFWIFRR